jgi:predicted TIM-barrel fold metal-dependent hydrolase
MIDGNIFPKPPGTKGSMALHTPTRTKSELARTDSSVGTRELTDIAGRLADMDKGGMETQVIYPTIFLAYITEDVSLEIALCRAYNSFLSDACSRSDGRMRFVAVLPLRSIDASIQEMHRVKELGAVGLFFRGVEGNRSLAEPYFYPIYEEANSLGLPICVHTAQGSPQINALFDVALSRTFPQSRVLPLMAFRDLVANRVPERFANLRWGFLEATASWVPFLLHYMKREFRRQARGSWGPELFEQYQLYVACESDEDIAYLAQYTGEDHIVTGSDYGHTDQSAEFALVHDLRTREDVPPRLIEKILCDNARNLYAL